MKPIAKSKKKVCHKVRIVNGKASKGGKLYVSWAHNEYDANGNLTHREDSDGFERRDEYDSNGNLIHRTEGNGYKWRWEYDAKGNAFMRSVHLD